ncbi:NAD-dependent epimerase/dehydratase family protein [Gemella haemolysans]|uniref:NAD-dependent epimerase/dehydratase family protein n=1 Tax=Gemella haemolysans TaxID=1379 RepID=UPI00195813EE|nr:NAD(P)-dependent oxidoreductase [Gemella haemolysans]VTX67443.1 NADH(P)-binding protein [Gemella haemolysans]
MNILLIGGNGFVGKALIKEFKKYNVKVSYLSRSQNHFISKEEATWIQGNIFDSENIVINEEYDIVIHLIGTIKNKNLYSKLNTESVTQTIKLCHKQNINKLVYFSANGGFKQYLESKRNGEKLVVDSKLNYLIIRPGLMYGKESLTSYFNILPIKFFSKLGITFFKKVYPLPVEKVAKSVVKAILDNTDSTIIEIIDMK